MKNAKISECHEQTADRRRRADRKVDDATAPPGAMADTDRERYDRMVLDAFGEDAVLVAEILMRRVEEMSRPGADEPYLHAKVDTELEALKRHAKQIQAIISNLQNLKRLYDRRRKNLGDLRDWFHSQGDGGRGR